MTLDRWQNISKRDQLGHIAAELARAKVVQDLKVYRAILEKALELVDLTLADLKWREQILTLLHLRGKIAETYESGEPAEAERIYAAI